MKRKKKQMKKKTKTMTDRTPENFRPPPVQEEGEPNMAANLKLVIDLLQKIPEVTHYLQAQGREPERRNRLRLIIDGLEAAIFGGYSRAKVFLVSLWTAFKSLFNVKREIQGEKLTEFENMKKTQEEVNTKQRKVLRDYEKMADKIKIAQETDYRIARKDDNELETGLVNAACDLDACQDVLNDVKAEFSDLLQGAKKVAVKQTALIIVLVFATALTAGFFAVTYQLQGRVDTSVSLVIVTIQLLICRWRVRVYFGNQMLLTKCEEFRKNELQKAEDLQKQLKRDVGKRLPALKAQLAVLDIDVSLYASLRPHSE